MKQKTYETTSDMRLLNESCKGLENLLRELMKPRKVWEHTVPLDEKLSVVKEITSTRAALWRVVYDKYPELVGKNLQYSEKQIIVL